MICSRVCGSLQPTSIPTLNLKKLKQDLEQIYYETWLEFRPDLYAFDQIKVINGVLFGKLKFGANTKNFHSPGNSMINVVLETHKGNPITLCVIYMLVAQKLKLPVYGVNLPNLFILTYKDTQTQFYINAFNRGLIFSKQDIETTLTNCTLCRKVHSLSPVLAWRLFGGPYGIWLCLLKKWASTPKQRK